MRQEACVPLNDVLTEFELSVKKQIKEYFFNKRRNFDFSFAIKYGTPFQKRVWCELCKIPYSATCTYSEIALRIGNCRASRAVGSACNKNPLLLVIPCHRVIAAQGRLAGFSCGVKIKTFLLDIEKN